MPRQRRNSKVHIDLARLYELQQCPSNRYSLRPSRVFSRAAHVPSQLQQQPSVFSRAVPRSRRQHVRRNTDIDIGNNAVWKTLVRPISILKWLPLHRSVRRRRSKRSRSSRNQRQNSVDSTKIGSRTSMPAAELAMPCCVTESPTAETQIHMHMINTDVKSQQQSYQEITPPLSTVILHHNPLFDVEGNTQSGLIGKHFLQLATSDQVKSIWPVQRAQTSKQKLLNSGESQDAMKQQDAEKKKSKSAVEKRRPAKKDSSEHSTPPSRSPSVSLSTVASSEQSKSDSDESNSYEENIDLTVQDSPGIIVAPLAELCTKSCTHQPGPVLECNTLQEPIAILDFTEPIEQKDGPESKETTNDVGTSTNQNTLSSFEVMLAD